jgi:oxygen-dependent protoporphyrinogen oxidase
MQSLVDALAEVNVSALRTNSDVRLITPVSSGSYEIALASGSLVLAKQVVLACPVGPSGDLIQALAPSAASRLREMRTVDSAVVWAGFPPGAIQRDVPGYGIVFPAAEKQPINAITISSRKFSARAPDGCDLVRVFVGGHRSPASLVLDDEQLTALALDSAFAWLGVTSPPLFSRVRRWVASSPQYDVGHLDRMTEIDAALPDGINVVGGAYRGIGIPDIVRDAERIVDLIVKSMRIRGGERHMIKGVV